MGAVLVFGVSAAQRLSPDRFPTKNAAPSDGVSYIHIKS